MNEEQKKHHMISDNLYKVLLTVKQLQNENINYFTFKQLINQQKEEIQKLKQTKGK